MTKKLSILVLGTFSALGLFFMPTAAAADCSAEQAAFDACNKTPLVCTNGEEAKLKACKEKNNSGLGLNAGLANNFGAQETPFPPAPPVSNQGDYDTKFSGCTVNTAAANYQNFYSCLNTTCAKDASVSTCELAAANYASRQKSDSVKEYEAATKAHFDEVVRYQNCQSAVNTGTGDKTAGLEACKDTHLDKIKELGKAKEEARNKGSVSEYEKGYGALAASGDQRALANAAKALQSQTGFFDLNNLKVGNEHKLEIGGADNNNQNIMARVINVMARLFGTVAVLMFVIGAFFMIVSQGDENQLQKGKTIVLYTIIGLLLGFTAYILVQFVINMLFQT